MKKKSTRRIKYKFVRFTTEKSYNHITHVFSCSVQYNEWLYWIYDAHETHKGVWRECECAAFVCFTLHGILPHTLPWICIPIATFPFFDQHTLISVFVCVCVCMYVFVQWTGFQCYPSQIVNFISFSVSLSLYRPPYVASPYEYSTKRFIWLILLFAVASSNNIRARCL